jgi:hypothetical protein
MRRNAVTKLMLVCTLLPMIGGCELLRLNKGREFAVQSAGYAGGFRIAYGRWPNFSELEEFSCMHGRADRFGLALLTCEEVVDAPFLTQLVPSGVHLRMQFFNSAQKEVCNLTVIAPPAREDKNAFPMIVIKTTVFSCRGDRHAAVADIG